MCSKTRDISQILKDVFPSAEMAAYLARCPFSDDFPNTGSHGLFDGTPPEKLPLRRYRVAETVAGAPIPLDRKRELFLQLAEGDADRFFMSLADKVQRAIQEMRLNPGEFFYLKCLCYDGDGTSDQGMEPYLSWEYLHERIREYLGYLEAEERELTWFQVEKWSPDGAGKLKNGYDYFLLGTEACYFSHNSVDRSKLDSSDHSEWIEFEANPDLNLPVPFHAGDIVTVDCRPSAPVSYALILEVGDNRDCCCLQALHRENDGTWNIGAVKHGHVLPSCPWPQLSPLYRLSTFHGQLPEEDCLLEQMSRYVNGDEKRGAALWEYVSRLKYDGKKQAVTVAQILSFMEDTANP